jgi:hypothetical protein
MVVIHSQYFLALFISQNKKFAEISFWSIIQASSQTSSLCFFTALTFAQMKFNTLNIAGVFSASSTSLMLKTVSALLMSIFV